jgi:hypothetical protein
MIINLRLKISRISLISIYILILSTILFIPLNFLSIWITIEIGRLVFLCIILSISSRVGYTSNILYFIIQACFGINIILFFYLENYIPEASVFTTLFILTKVGAAPLNILYFYSLNYLDTLLLFIALSFQKIFPVILFIAHSASSFFLIIMFFIISSLSMGAISLNANPLRIVLIVRSLFNSSWIILSSLAGQLIFLLYLFIYTLCLFFILFKNVILIPIITLMGLPPLPLFFVKLIISYFLLILSSTFLVSLILFTLFTTSLVILSIYFNTLTQLH